MRFASEKWSIVLMLLLSISQCSSLSGDIDLNKFPNPAGFTINGAAAGDQSGWSVKSAGDVNGDGVDDMIVGANGADPVVNGTTRSNAGISYVLFGRSLSVNRTALYTNIDLLPLNTAGSSLGFAILGAAENDASGYSVSGAGDVNGDGLSDIIVGANGADPVVSGTTRWNAGISYVIFGRNKTTNLAASYANIDLLTLNTAGSALGFAILGAVGGVNSGWSVSGAGDMNGDGLSDVIVGSGGLATVIVNGTTRSSAGISYVIFGRSKALNLADSIANIDLTPLNSAGSALGFAILGAVNSDQSGRSVRTTGDVNGDGLSDVIVGAPYARVVVSGTTRSNAGMMYVIFGRSKTTNLAASYANIDLLSLNTAGSELGFAILGAVAGDLTARLGAAGDVNGDGVADVIVGTNNADPVVGGSTRTNAGMSYVLFGRSKAASYANIDLLPLNTVGSALGFAIIGAVGGDQHGYSGSTAGDVNGDGVDDVIVGSYTASFVVSSSTRSSAGISYVIYGRRYYTGNPTAYYKNIDLATISPIIGFRILGAATNDCSGVSVNVAGDLNQDGLADVIVGAHLRAGAAGGSSGASYVIFGAYPSTQPSSAPSNQPSGQPSGIPSAQPTTHPTTQPSRQPSQAPSVQPTDQPSGRPSLQPTGVPSDQPSSQPSAQPSSLPSAQPTQQPSSIPSMQPSARPSLRPSAQPSAQPTSQPISTPSAAPSVSPSSAPSSSPSTKPSCQPSSQPSRQPSGKPHAEPSVQPSSVPTRQPTIQPSNQPANTPSSQPSSEPSGQPSEQPASKPSSQLSGLPTSASSVQPSSQPTTQPSCRSSALPTGRPTSMPSSQPSGQPRGEPSAQPSALPTLQPTAQPSGQPTSSASSQPSGQPRAAPSAQPTGQPTTVPSAELTRAQSGEWATLVNEAVLLTNVNYANDYVWSCGRIFKASAARCVLVDPLTGSVLNAFQLDWDTVTAVLSTSVVNSVVLVGIGATENVATSEVATCTTDQGQLNCQAQSFYYTDFLAASYVPYPNKIVYVGWNNVRTSITMMDVQTGVIQSYLYTASNMKALTLSQIQSPPAFVGSIVAGTAVRATATPVNYIMVGMFRTDGGSLRAMAIMPVSGDILNSANLVTAMALEYTGPDSFIAGGLQLADIAGTHAYLLRANALFNTISYCVRYTSVAGGRRALSAATAVAQSVVRGMVRVDNALFMIVVATHYNVTALTVLKASIIDGAIDKQVHVNPPNNTNLHCTDISVVNTYLSIVCTLQRNVSSVRSVMFLVDQALSFTKLLDGFVRSEQLLLQKESLSFQRTALSITQTPATLATSTYEFTTGDLTPTCRPSLTPSYVPTSQPSTAPSGQPSSSPTAAPSVSARPTSQPSSAVPTITYRPTVEPTDVPTRKPIAAPTARPSFRPTVKPSARPSEGPTVSPTTQPSASPTGKPTRLPSAALTRKPTCEPTRVLTHAPSLSPTLLQASVDSVRRGSNTPSFVVGASVGGGLGAMLLGYVLYKVYEHYEEKRARALRKIDYMKKQALLAIQRDAEIAKYIQDEEDRNAAFRRQEEQEYEEKQQRRIAKRKPKTSSGGAGAGAGAYATGPVQLPLHVPAVQHDCTDGASSEGSNYSISTLHSSEMSSALYNATHYTSEEQDVEEEGSAVPSSSELSDFAESIIGLSDSHKSDSSSEISGEDAV